VPRYLILRRFSVDESAMPRVGRRSRELVENDFPEIVWEHSHVIVDEDGFVSTYCVYTGPDEETIRRHAALLGDHNISELHEIAGDVTPSDFPPEAAAAEPGRAAD
jgi:Protein of unknown function (DUF4242)